MVKHGTPWRASEVTGSRFMLRGTGALGEKGLAGHSEAYRCYSVAQGQASEVLEGGCGHRFTIGGLSDDLLRPTWAPHGHRRRARPWAEGPEGPNFESPAKCPDLLGIESLTPWGTPTSI